MSHYADYMAEREGISVLETESGFASYRIDGEKCWILDIYVAPEYRKSYAASSMADAVTSIAREQGCTLLVGSVAPDTNGATTSLRVLLGYGFDLYGIDHAKNLIMFVKEI